MKKGQKEIEKNNKNKKEKTIIWKPKEKRQNEITRRKKRRKIRAREKKRPRGKETERAANKA